LPPAGRGRVSAKVTSETEALHTAGKRIIIHDVHLIQVNSADFLVTIFYTET
jgi:hypothetical protein